MTSEEEPDLPVTALFVENTEEPYCSDIYFSEEGFNSHNIHDLQYFKDSEVHNVVECTRRSDAEAAIAKERSRKYDEGFFEGRQSREEEILDKIKDKREKFNNGRSNEHPQTVLTEILQKIRRSRQHEM